MDTCTSCGANLVENSSFCHMCGAVVEKNTTTQEFSVSSEDVTKKVRELLHEGNVSRIVVKNETGKSLLEIPVTAGAVGILLAPWLAAAGVDRRACDQVYHSGREEANGTGEADKRLLRLSGPSRSHLRVWFVYRSNWALCAPSLF